jgi:hypothetical protein
VSAIAEKDRPAVDRREDDDEPWPPPGVKELTLDDLLETMVQQAEEDLQRNSIDGLEILIERLRELSLPPEQWQPREDVRRQVNEFMNRHFRRVGGKLVFKHPRGQLSSARRNWARFRANPNHIAAVLVRAEKEADRWHGRSGKPKQRLKRIVDKINARPVFRDYPPEKQASTDNVRELLRRGRGKRPRNPYEDEDNPPD